MDIMENKVSLDTEVTIEIMHGIGIATYYHDACETMHSMPLIHHLFTISQLKTTKWTSIKAISSDLFIKECFDACKVMNVSI